MTYEPLESLSDLPLGEAYVGEVLRALKHRKDEPVLEAGASFTGGDILASIARWQAHFAELGLRAGDRCALAMGDNMEVLAARLAVQAAGGIVVGLPPFQSPALWAMFVRVSEPAFIVAEGAMKSRLVEALAESGDHDVPLVWAEEVLAGPADPDAEIDVLTVDPDSPTKLRFTSGSTGTPKGIITTHQGDMANRRAFEKIFRLPEEDVQERYLSLIPLTDLGADFVWSAVTRGSRVVVYTGRPSPEGILRAIEEHAANTMFLPSSQLKAVAESPALEFTDLSAWKLALYGGQSMPVAAIRTVREALPCALRQVYGQTECGLVALLDEHDHQSDDDAVLGSAGKPAPGLDFRLARADGSDVAVGETGSILLRGPSVSPGAWGVGRVEEDWVEDWRNTGDLGSLDDEGRLTIRGRTRDTILYRGFVIYVRDVVEVLCDVPGVTDAAVHAVSSEDVGERVFAWVVTDREIDPEELRTTISNKLGPWYVPSGIRFLRELPTKSNLAKADIQLLRHAAENDELTGYER